MIAESTFQDYQLLYHVKFIFLREILLWIRHHLAAVSIFSIALVWVDRIDVGAGGTGFSA